MSASAYEKPAVNPFPQKWKLNMIFDGGHATFLQSPAWSAQSQFEISSITG